MKEFRKLVVIVPAIVLTVLLVVLFFTRQTMQQLEFLHRVSGAEAGLADQRPYQTAQILAALAVSSEELGLAQEAERLADHEVDQAFAMALRQASMQQHVLSPQATEIQGRVAELKQLVKDDQVQVDAATSAKKGSGIAAAEGDEVDVAKAQLQLDTDELTDATDDLARVSGDTRGAIQQELQTREAAMKKSEGQTTSKNGDSAVVSAEQEGTLRGQARAWFRQKRRVALLAEAEQKARADASDMARQHAELEAVNNRAALNGKAGGERVKTLQTLAGQRVLMSILDDRQQTQQQLAAIYARWEQQVWVQHRIVEHLLLESFAWVTFIVLISALLGMIARLIVHRVATDTRRARTLNTIVTLFVEGIALIAILLIIFGVPQQMPTILGLAGAGLTLVFRDMILSFFGWFVLMGRNGVRVSDWVEIDGVGGEVAAIGLLKTTLLETGNWTARGHPTGRKVTFQNSFALGGKYFNFSTHGQWMWDEIKLNVPATADLGDVVKQMQQIVEKETCEDAEQAEKEWKAATKQNLVGQFSAKPMVDLRPAATGVDVLVRFVTRAGGRFELRKRLYANLIGLLQTAVRPAVTTPEAVSTT